MARKKLYAADKVISTRLQARLHEDLQEIASFETIQTGRQVSVQELIRNALIFTYYDNERLRECFRRSRAHLSKKFYKKYLNANG